MFFFFNDTATTEIYTLSLHDALPIWFGGAQTLGIDFHESLLIGADLRGVSFRKKTLEGLNFSDADLAGCDFRDAVFHKASLRDAHLKKARFDGDRKSTRLNSSHSQISYAVFCLKKKNQ